MSLVAYGSSSDEESDDESITNGSINEEPIKNNQLPDIVSSDPNKKKALNLPLPLNNKTTNEIDENLFNSDEPLKFNLPAPMVTANVNGIHEKDDEFLHKKEKVIEKPPPLPKRREPVRIVIPSLSSFETDKNDPKVSSVPLGPKTAKSCGLLDLLPTPKVGLPSKQTKTSVLNLVPKSVSDKKANTQKMANKPNPSTTPKSSEPIKLTINYDSDEADDESGDFFSLNSTNDLPAEKLEKINELVAEKVRSIAKNAGKFQVSEMKTNEEEEEEEEQPSISEEASCSKMDEKTMQALCGSSAKRARIDNVDIIELSDDQVLPNRDEWLRHQLTAATEYQPRGLVDEEPAAGTRKKHQITYLAHQAKANELELQAMWASNRHARRLTQNKYGF